MGHIFISQLQTGQQLVDFYMVKSIAVKVGSNKKKYLDVQLGDKTGDISAKKWDVVDEELTGLNKIQEGNIAKVAATVNEWNGMKQLRVSKIRKGQKEDNTNLSDYIKTAPEPSEEMYEYILSRAEAFEDKDLRTLCVNKLESRKEKLLYWPAASRNHHAELGGLLWHVKRMLMMGERACEVYTSLDKDLVLAGVILHDMEKMKEIKSNEYGVSDGYTFEGNMLGHLVEGVKVLDKEMTDLDFPYEKKIMIEHMVLSHHYEPEYGSPKRPLFPEAEMLHYLDVLDARMYDFEDAISKTAPGEFSDSIWTLDKRRLYRRSENGEPADMSPDRGTDGMENAEK